MSSKKTEYRWLCSPKNRSKCGWNQEKDGGNTVRKINKYVCPKCGGSIEVFQVEV